MDRQEGYYWVKYNDEYIIAYCYICGMGYPVWTSNKFLDGYDVVRDSNLQHINENRIKEPGELPD